MRFTKPSPSFATRSFATRSFGSLGLLCLAAALPACEGSPGDDTTDDAPRGAETATQGVIICNYDTFEVEVTGGPSAGKRVEGSLLLVLEPPGSRLVGTLGTADGAIPVTGAFVVGGEVSLTFHTPDGYLMGLGRTGDDFCQGDARLEGVAVGPRVSETDDLGESDTGHWLLASPNRLVDLSGSFALAEDPVEGTVYEAAAAPAGCTTSGATQTCNSAVYPDAGSATGCSQSTGSCTFDGTRNECSSTHVPVDCPN